MSKAIQDLLALVKLLRYVIVCILFTNIFGNRFIPVYREEVAHQTNEINHLRRLIENCAGCAPPTRENCDNLNPCFEGVQCRDDGTNGVRCGRCPNGYIGNGRDCRPGINCNDRPCFP